MCSAVRNRNDAVGVAVERHGRDGDDRLARKLVLDVLVSRFAIDQASGRSGSRRRLVGIVVRQDASVERSIVEFPVRRPLPP
jgi:hypothetical protein